MDRPKINIRAWQPIDRRKKVDISKLKKQSIFVDKKIYGEFEDSYQPEIIIPKNNTAQHNRYYKQEDNIGNDFYINKHKHKKKKTTFFNIRVVKTIGIGIGAIVTGVLLGYIVLNLFVGNNQQEPLIIVPSNNSQIVNYNDNIQTIAGQVIHEQRTYLIQAGVFSNISGAEAIVKKQKDLGRTAVIKQDNSYYVFVGISNSKEQANLLKELLVFEDADLYTKEYIISSREFNMEDSTFTIFYNFINKGQELVSILSEDSIQALVNTQYKINYDEIQKTHQEFLLDIQTLKAALEEENLTVEKDLVQNMSDQINYAIAAVNAHKKNPNSQYLWNIQELLIKYELYYEGYVKKVE
ncbi:MAG: SPOR domain-containing protein [Vulcanibacillus sp.]